MVDQAAPRLSDHSSSPRDFRIHCYRASAGSLPWVKKRVFVEKTRCQRTQCPGSPWRPCPGRHPLGASPTGLCTGPRCNRQVPRQPRNLLDDSGTTVPRARGQRRMHSPSPARRLAPRASAGAQSSPPSPPRTPHPSHRRSRRPRASGARDLPAPGRAPARQRFP